MQFAKYLYSDISKREPGAPLLDTLFLWWGIVCITFALSCDSIGKTFIL